MRVDYRRTRCGFTLIELLVVIAIIAILAAILFPIVAAAEFAAKSTTDLSNMRSIGLALRLYLNDNDDESPLMWMPAIQHQESWVDDLQPYSRCRLLNRSPLDDSPLWDTPSSARRTSYALNGWFDKGHFAYYYPGYPTVSFSTTAEPAQCVFAMPLAVRRLGTDFLITGDHFMPEYWGSPSKMNSSVYEPMQWSPELRRPKTVVFDQGGGKANILFVDGHAQRRGFDSLFRQVSGTPASVDRFDPLFSD